MPKKKSAMHRILPQLDKTPTGINGFDEITGGGLPKGRPTTFVEAQVASSRAGGSRSIREWQEWEQKPTRLGTERKKLASQILTLRAGPQGAQAKFKRIDRMEQDD